MKITINEKELNEIVKKHIIEKLKIKPEYLKSIEYRAVDYVLNLEEVVIDIENK